LLVKLTPIADQVHALASNDTVEFSCAVYATRAPALYFDAGMLVLPARLGAAFDIDLYIVRQFRTPRRLKAPSERRVLRKQRKEERTRKGIDRVVRVAFAWSVHRLRA
jgi:hypothetical protein